MLATYRRLPLCSTDFRTVSNDGSCELDIHIWVSMNAICDGSVDIPWLPAFRQLPASCRARTEAVALRVSPVPLAMTMLFWESVMPMAAQVRGRSRPAWYHGCETI